MIIEAEVKILKDLKIKDKKVVVKIPT